MHVSRSSDVRSAGMDEDHRALDAAVKTACAWHEKWVVFDLAGDLLRLRFNGISALRRSVVCTSLRKRTLFT